MGQVLFIVWRESVEALLVVGILNAWMNHNPAGRAGKPWLWGGVALGLAMAIALAVALFTAGSLMAGAQDYFQTGMVFIAAALIVQMVLWMREHGRTLKKELESGLSEKAASNNWWGVTVLAALAIAREGSETVVFLYGMLAEAGGMELARMGAAGLVGLLLAFLTFYLLQLGGKVLSWRLFFRVTEIMLLLLGASLFLSGVEKLISMDVLPALVDPLWDSSALLDDMSPFGGVVAALTGYRSHPALMSLIAYALFWAAIWSLFQWRNRRLAVAA
ncbi:High-affinity Fe2+/Pb2+ permease [Chromobacterium violaceum]|uniref:FTR1 family iron permease n=3 Tax=Chromobacterium violaceum TaxID=536 RepID=A0A202BG86_CHRVL|nr:FTR1 family protein [Chromobacterium violaceum]ATP27578.1 FTR1 family iron permease [Chromobacterium violaceum]ATP31492.1 FTR1 family iron permease [Chromobacterium violaceum]KMN50657.1 FTR1 family iron permease [Chromobacterium violaceum]KMN87153.1 FTR1 family iron permease [Chromobacterium violaceum]KMN89722.1 FTR1 family iron permease [Chromobacterium violaceum]